jgi:hypothetical protein
MPHREILRNSSAISTAQSKRFASPAAGKPVAVNVPR